MKHIPDDNPMKILGHERWKSMSEAEKQVLSSTQQSSSIDATACFLFDPLKLLQAVRDDPEFQRVAAERRAAQAERRSERDQPFLSSLATHGCYLRRLLLVCPILCHIQCRQQLC